MDEAVSLAGVISPPWAVEGDSIPFETDVIYPAGRQAEGPNVDGILPWPVDRILVMTF